ncbi:unnamed protein product [Amoebophrya sp. A120]|nr:unnamed protein product [Amoebophrya sp. A120]|eukprot:GSA120T00012538001.1
MSSAKSPALKRQKLDPAGATTKTTQKSPRAQQLNSQAQNKLLRETKPSGAGKLQGPGSAAASPRAALAPRKSKMDGNPAATTGRAAGDEKEGELLATTTENQQHTSAVQLCYPLDSTSRDEEDALLVGLQRKDGPFLLSEDGVLKISNDSTTCRTYAEFSYPIEKTKASLDKNEYRHIRMHNGIHAVLVSLKNEDEDEEAVAGRGEQQAEDEVEHTGRNHDAGPAAVDGSSLAVKKSGNNDNPPVPASPSKGSDAADDVKAACAVSVGVGQFSDPAEAQGIAHFCEHMLFMGSSKYPGENAHEQWLTQNGGYSNAFTECEQTTYYFECDNEGFEKACDMTSQFFIDPLFEKDAVEREIKAIESEFRLSQNSDQTRIDQVLAHLCTKGHVYNSFGWGNWKSLWETPLEEKKNVYELVKKFYREEYLTSRISVCLVGCMPLDELERCLRNSFGQIPKREGAGAAARGEQQGQEVLPSSSTTAAKVEQMVKKNPATEDEPPRTSKMGMKKAPPVAAGPSSSSATTNGNNSHDHQNDSDAAKTRAALLSAKTPIAKKQVFFPRNPLLPFSYRKDPQLSSYPPIKDSELPMLLRQKPVADTHKLYLAWVLPPIKDPKHLFYQHPLEIISYCIGHESKGSILEYLKQKHYATSLAGGQGQSGYEDSSICTMFTIEIGLTKKGLQHWDEVVEIVFAGMEMIRLEFEKLHGELSDSGAEGEQIHPVAGLNDGTASLKNNKTGGNVKMKRASLKEKGANNSTKVAVAVDTKSSTSNKRTSAAAATGNAGAAQEELPEQQQKIINRPLSKLHQIYAEARLLNNLEFQFSEEERGIETAQRIVATLAPCSGIRKCDVLTGAYFFPETPDLELAYEYFKQMSIDRCILGILSSSYGQAVRNEEEEDDEEGDNSDDEDADAKQDNKSIIKEVASSIQKRSSPRQSDVGGCASGAVINIPNRPRSRSCQQAVPTPHNAAGRRLSKHGSMHSSDEDLSSDSLSDEEEEEEDSVSMSAEGIINPPAGRGSRAPVSEMNKVGPAPKRKNKKNLPRNSDAEPEQEEELSDEDASRMTVRSAATSRTNAAHRKANEKLDPWLPLGGAAGLDWEVEPYFETEFHKSEIPFVLLKNWRNRDYLRKKYFLGGNESSSTTTGTTKVDKNTASSSDVEMLTPRGGGDTSKVAQPHHPRIHFPPANPFLPKDFRLLEPEDGSRAESSKAGATATGNKTSGPAATSRTKRNSGNNAAGSCSATHLQTASGKNASAVALAGKDALSFTPPSLPEGPLAKSLRLKDDSVSGPVAVDENTTGNNDGTSAIMNSHKAAKNTINAKNSKTPATSAIKSVSNPPSPPAQTALHTLISQQIVEKRLEVPRLFEKSEVCQLPDRLISRFEKKTKKTAQILLHTVTVGGASDNKKAATTSAQQQEHQQILTPLYRFYSFHKHFDMPKTHVFLRLYPTFHDILSTIDSVCLTWLCRTLEDRQSDIAYQADTAQLHFSITSAMEGYLVLHFWGFSEKLADLMRAVLGNVMRFCGDYGLKTPGMLCASRTTISTGGAQTGGTTSKAANAGANSSTTALNKPPIDNKEQLHEHAGELLHTDGRVEAIRQKLARKYANANLDASSHSDRLRQELLVASCHDLEAQVAFIDPQCEEEADSVAAVGSSKTANQPVDFKSLLTSTFLPGGGTSSTEGIKAFATTTTALKSGATTAGNHKLNPPPRVGTMNATNSSHNNLLPVPGPSPNLIPQHKQTTRERSSSKTQVNKDNPKLDETYAKFAEYAERFFSLFRIDMLIEGNFDTQLQTAVADLVKAETGCGTRTLSPQEQKMFTIVGSGTTSTPAETSAVTAENKNATTNNFQSDNNKHHQLQLTPAEQFLQHYPIHCNYCQKLPKNTTLLTVQPSADAKQKNTVITLYYQFERTSPTLSAANEFLQDLLYEPMFNELRTKQQLGYSVNCAIRDTYGVAGFMFTICSSSFDCVYLLEKLLKFIHEFDLVKELGEEAIEQVRHNCAKKLLEPCRNLTDLAALHWGCMTETRAPRWQHDREIAYSLKHADVVGLWNQIRNFGRRTEKQNSLLNGRILTVVLSEKTEKAKAKLEQKLTKLLTTANNSTVNVTTRSGEGAVSATTSTSRKLEKEQSQTSGPAQLKVVKYAESRKFWRLKKSREVGAFFHPGDLLLH